MLTLFAVQRLLRRRQVAQLVEEGCASGTGEVQDTRRGEEKYVTSLHTGYNIDTADGRMEQWQKWYIETGREEEPKCL